MGFQCVCNICDSRGLNGDYRVQQQHGELVSIVGCILTCDSPDT